MHRGTVLDYLSDLCQSNAEDTAHSQLCLAEHGDLHSPGSTFQEQLWLSCNRSSASRARPGQAQLNLGRAGLNFARMATGRTEKSGPVQTSNVNVLDDCDH